MEIKVRAPGRINLIGEHTDCNSGFVLPCAIDKEITVAGKRWDFYAREPRMNLLEFSVG